MAKSPNVTGPYTSYVHNPVLTNANTSQYRRFRHTLFAPADVDMCNPVTVQTVGHADLFTDAAGNWWAVSLATRNATVNL